MCVRAHVCVHVCVSVFTCTFGHPLCVQGEDRHLLKRWQTRLYNMKNINRKGDTLTGGPADPGRPLGPRNPRGPCNRHRCVVCLSASVCLWNILPPLPIPPYSPPPPPFPTVLSQTADFSLQHNIEGPRPEWCISSMIYSRDTPFWLETLDDNYVNHFSHCNVRLSNATSTSSFVNLSANST